MIVQLTGTLLEVTPSRVVMDVGGVGYELGVSSTTAAALPHAGEAGVTVLARMIVREDAMELYGFATREERALFEAAVASIDDTTYKPLNVATQVVAGTNYRFVCKAREKGRRGKRFDAVIVIYKPLPGQGEPRITSIERSTR